MITRLFVQLRETAEMIKVSHSVFALPFALAAGALAMRESETWSWSTLFWIVFCAVTARTAAMAQNRLIDAGLDAENPRTANRALPGGRVSRGFVIGLVVVSSLLFVVGAWKINSICFRLSPLALFVLLAYPWTKRFTLLCHFWLGAALGLAPVGAWLAVRGAWQGMATPLLFGFAVAFWTAGFDLIYACQDAAHDREAGLHSVPARLGVSGALRLARLLHGVSLALLISAGWTNPHLGWIYALGLCLAAGLLVYEHSLVRTDDLSRVNVAFFTLNGLVSLVLGGLAVVDAMV